MTPGGRALALMHLHQRSAALDARERLAGIVEAIGHSPDLLGLATCHRIELYASIPSEENPSDWYRERLGLAPDDGLLADAALLMDTEAATHLFRVAAGLDSAIQGEGQIIGQVRRAYDAARQHGPVDPILGAVFSRALAAAREVRATTRLGSVRRSVGSLAVDEVVRLLTDPTTANVLVVGAGEVGKLATRALAQRVGSVTVANRDQERAKVLAESCGAVAIGLDELPIAISRAAAVISAADSRGGVLSRELLAARCAKRPLVLVDMAVPRSVDDEARAVPGLTYRSVDDLVDDGGPLAPETVEFAESWCAAQAELFRDGLRARDAAGVIGQLRAQGARLRGAHLERALSRLGHLAERDRRVVEALADGLTSALLHEPTVALRREPQRADQARDLFALDRAPSEPPHS